MEIYHNEKEDEEDVLEDTAENAPDEATLEKEAAALVAESKDLLKAANKAKRQFKKDEHARRRQFFKDVKELLYPYDYYSLAYVMLGWLNYSKDYFEKNGLSEDSNQCADEISEAIRLLNRAMNADDAQLGETDPETAQKAWQDAFAYIGEHLREWWD